MWPNFAHFHLPLYLYSIFTEREAIFKVEFSGGDSDEINDYLTREEVESRQSFFLQNSQQMDLSDY